MEFLHKLNLPPLTSVIREDIKETFFTEFFKSRVNVYPSDEILKPEFLNLKGLRWSPRVTLFCKTPDSDGVIHIDNPVHEPRLHANILWVHRNGGLRFWDEDKIISRKSAIDTYSDLPMTVFEVENPPTKDYKTANGGVYLVNASVAHTGYNDKSETENRYSLALRCAISQYPKWDELVDTFSDLIID